MNINYGKNLGVKLFDNFVSIDLETTGLKTDVDEIIEIGLAKYINGELSETKSYLLSIESKIPDKIIDITGITDEMLKNKPKFKYIINIIMEFIGNFPIVGQNTNFDLRFLNYNMQKYEKNILNDYIDTISIAKNLHKLDSYKLNILLDMYGIKIENHHRALDDAIATAKLYLKFIEKIKRENLTFDEIKSKGSKSFYKNTVRISELQVEDDSMIDEGHPLYKKRVCCTGNFEKISRKEALQAVTNIGGIPANGVTKALDYLVVGTQDTSLIKDGVHSSKELKAFDLIEKGHDIKILNEEEFLHILEGESTYDEVSSTIIDEELIIDNKNLCVDSENVNIADKILIKFRNSQEKMEKLKEWGLLSPKTEEKHLKERLEKIKYKTRDGEYSCDIIGYYTKETNLNCIDRAYETLVIQTPLGVKNISPAFLKEMKSPSFKYDENQE